MKKIFLLLMVSIIFNNNAGRDNGEKFFQKLEYGQRFRNNKTLIKKSEQKYNENLAEVQAKHDQQFNTLAIPVLLLGSYVLYKSMEPTLQYVWNYDSWAQVQKKYAAKKRRT